MSVHDGSPSTEGAPAEPWVTPERAEALLAELRVLESEMFTLDVILAQRGLDPDVREEAETELAIRRDAVVLARLEIEVADALT